MSVLSCRPTFSGILPIADAVNLGGIMWDGTSGTAVKNVLNLLYDVNGQMSLGSGVAPGAMLDITARDAAIIGLQIEAASAQTANLLEINTNGGSGGDLLTVLAGGNVGINEISPSTLLELSHTAPYITLHNTTEEDTDYGRESRILFKGEQSGAEETTLGYMEFAHDGTDDDQKGIFTLATNDGADGDTPTARVTVDSAGNVNISRTIELPATTSSTTGVLYKGAYPFIHNFKHPTGGGAVPVGYNTFVGINAGNFTMGSTATETYHASSNSAMGYYALRSNTTGNYNSAMGRDALFSNTTGSYNSAMGYYALFSNTTGSYNSAMGRDALRSNTIGYSNSAMGRDALYYNTTGNYNSAMGVDALRSNTTGSSNLAMGVSALRSNTTGNSNLAMGVDALRSNTTGNYNSAMGVDALYSNTTGSSNSAMGYYALYYNTTGNYNSAMGVNALRSNTTGSYNSAMGRDALRSNTTGSYNLAMGYYALYNVKPTSGAITAFADYSGTVAGTVSATSVAHGLPVGTTINIRIAGTTNYDGLYTVTYIDDDSFYFTDTWVSNDATGWWGKDTEGRYNVGIGYQAGDNITTGSNNLIIGYNIDAPSATGDAQLNIGDAIYGNLGTGYIGLGEASPETLLELSHTAPYITLHNTTEEDGDYGRESRILFKGEQSGAEETTLGYMEFAHDGTGDDQAGIFTLATNDGTDGDTPTARVTVDSAGKVGIGTTGPQDLLHVHHGDSGATAVATGMIIERDQGAALNFLSPSGAYTQSILFGDAADADIGSVSYSHNSNNLIFTANTIEAMRIQSDGDIEIMNGNVGIGEATPTAVLHLKAGTATASTAPLKFTSGTLLGTPEVGTVEFANNKYYITNVATQRVIDRTSSVIVETTTVANSDTETVIYTCASAANSLIAGNHIHVDCSGVISNNSASDDITFNLYCGSNLVHTYNPAIGNVTSAPWHAQLEITIRTIGGSGTSATHGHIEISGNEDISCTLESIDTTTSNDLTLKVQWDNAKADNTVSIYQGSCHWSN